MRSIAAKRDSNEANDPERRKLPSAIGVGEEEASRSMHTEYGSKQHGNEHYGSDACEDASN